MIDASGAARALSAKRQALLDALLQEEGLAPAAAQVIPRRAEAETAPASFAQRRLWFLDQLQPGAAQYHIPLTLRLSGWLDTAALQAALDAIIRRHETLRTRFAVRDGEPVQVILPSLALPLAITDLSSLPADQREAEAERLAAEAARRPFDLAAGPLLRVGLVRLAVEEHLLLLTLHHIVSDGWSRGVLVRELGELYEAFRHGRAPRLPDLPIQYADFAIWQRQWLQGDVLESQLAFWREQLAGAPAVLELPTDHPRPAERAFRGGSQSVQLSASLTVALQQLSQREGATLFMTLLAAFQALLFRYTGQADLVVGTPIANRTRPELEGLIGFFVNTLAMRADLSGDPSFRNLLAQVRETALGAYAHQDLPFEKLVEELRPERSRSHTPLFQVMFALQNAPRPPLQLSGLTLQPVRVERETTKFDLGLFVIETPQGLRASLQYDRDLFEPETIERLLRHFVRLLEAIVEEPARRLAGLPLLRDFESRQILVEWNDTAAGYPQDQCLHELFEAQVARTPAAIALRCGADRLSFAQLNAQANQLAHILRHRGIGPEQCVAMCLPRTSQLIVALLAILKAGGAYVPLDPAYPRERLALILHEARPALLLTHTALRDRLPAHPAPSFYLDAEAAAIAAASDANPERGARPDQLAYVLYTSGSSGRPKGVAIEHRSPVALVSWAESVFSPAERAGVLASTSICFDLSVFELFVPLCSGGTVILAENVLALPELPTAEQVTLVNSVPAALAELLGHHRLPAGVRTVNLAGEPLPPALVNQLYAQGGVERVYDLYGPSEDTTYSTFALRRAGEAATIGRPIANTRVYLLDEQREVVPIGVAGEIYLGGAGLARGYLRRPEWTAERFVPDPFSRQPGDRLYRTGDLARYDADGNLEFLGRRDHQVKIRGFRIELGEIEATLSQHPGVREGVVVTSQSGTEKRLVAYWVPVKQPAPGSRELRHFLQERLPSYMLPAVFIPLDALPRTPNGKVDRRALPAPAVEGRAPESGFVAPRTSTEEALAGIWTEVLRLETIGVEDDFFERGGHSLLATQVIARIQDQLGVTLPLRAMFESPTIAGLAERLAALLGENGEGPRCFAPIPIATRAGALPLSFAQQRLWFLDQLQPGSASYNIPAALRLTGHLNGAALEQALTEIVRRHEALRTRFVEAGGAPCQVIDPAAAVGLPVVSLTSLSPPEREAAARVAALEEAQRPFDMARGPLLRSTLVRLASEEHLLLLTMHHVVSDGWSMGVLVRELGALYTAFAAGMPSPLPELPIQYADFAVWQRQWLQGEALESQLAYWRQRLAGAPSGLALPTDRPRPAVRSFRGARRSFRLEPDLSHELADLSRREGATLFMTLLAAFQALLFRYTGQEDLVVGTPIANRTRPELEGLIGFFVNTLPMRADLSGDPSFRELLGRVRETALGAYAHQDLPFEKLVDALQPERDTGQTPLFQVLFALQNAPRESLQLPGLTLERLKVDPGTAKFDLMLLMSEGSEALQGTVEFSTELFDAETIERLLGHWQSLLAGIVADPSRPVGRLSLLMSEERELWLDQWARRPAENETGVEFLPRFEAQAEQTPEVAAVVWSEGSLTYRELNARANQWARCLQRQGVGPEARVGLFLDRSSDLAIAVLAVLKAGAAYVPLDPDYPEARLAFMLDDSQAALVLTHEALRSRLIGARVPVLAMDTAGVGIEPESRENLDCPATGANLAYVIYTSGSTGQPKGVAMPRAALTNLVDWQLRSSPGPARTLQFASASFDVSFQELFATWCAGGTLVLASEAERRDPELLLRTLDVQGVERLFLPFVALQQLAEAAARCGAVPRSVREIITAGEQLRSTPALRQWMHALDGGVLQNQYGPTESHVVTAFTLHGSPVGWPELPPIGHPIDRVRVYVLDDALQPVPAGVPGELFIGGVALARGYLNRPELTAERFVPDPWSGEPGARLYRTGDRALCRPDGNIEFLGRRDDQVKVRGFRVELGEIEAALSQHPAVRECAAAVREDGAGQNRVVAYVVLDAARAVPTPELLAFLRRRLPEYLIPAAVAPLESLPLTPSGKVDRRALPDPGPARPELPQSFEAPRTAIEERVAAIWRELLRLERVGVHDRFFDLGGHSLLATQVIARIRSVLGVELPLLTIFQTPTVAGLAEAIDAAVGTGAEPDELECLLAELEGLSDEQVEHELRLASIDPGGAA